MQPVEALLRVIAMAKTLPDYEATTPKPLDQELRKDDQSAIQTAEAVLATLLPIAKYRVFIEFTDKKGERREYFVSCLRADLILISLKHLSEKNQDVRVVVFEQGVQHHRVRDLFQGMSRSKAYKDFLDRVETLDDFVLN